MKGTVRADDERGDTRGGRVYPGYWRVENGIVPVSGSAAADTVVVLDGVEGQAPAAKTVTVEIEGFQARDRLVVIGTGSVVEFKNADRVAHELHTPDDPSVMGLESLRPGSVRLQKFGKTGGYLVRCAQYPHITVSVIVVNHPHFAVADERGGFSISGVPEGSATLKIWRRGRWVHQEKVEITKKGAQVSVEVNGARAPAAGGAADNKDKPSNGAGQ